MFFNKQKIVIKYHIKLLQLVLLCSLFIPSIADATVNIIWNPKKINVTLGFEGVANRQATVTSTLST